MHHPRAVATVLVLALCSLVSGCGSSNSTSIGDRAAAQAPEGGTADFSCPAPATTAGAAASGPLAGGRLQVVTTVAPITSIVANIAGDKADVHGIIPEGQDSHTYEPKPSVAALVSKADIVFVNGLKLEDPTKDIAVKNIPKAGEVVELGTLTIRPDQYIYDFSFPKEGGKPNPHLWTNPPMAKCYATIAASAMSKMDPDNASYYMGNLAKFGAKIDQLDNLMVDATAGMPSRNRELLTYHDAYAYFAVHYGWKIIGAVQVSSFEDPTPKEVAALVKQIKAEKVPAIFGSEVFPSQILEQLAQETGVKYVDELRDDDLPDAPGTADHSYLGLMKFDFATMVASLGGVATNLKGFDASDVVPDTADYPQ